MQVTSESVVELVDHMGTDLSIVNAARVSFSKWQAEFSEGDVRLLHYLAKHNHWSPFAHTSIQLRVTAPIFVARQLAKHQVGLSWNEVSRRYVDDSPVMFVPKNWRARPDGSIKQGSGAVHVDSDLWRGAYSKRLAYAVSMYEEMLEDGIAPEQARMILPQSMMTSWIWTGSLMAFRRVYDLRIDSHAQVETQEVARLIGEHCYNLFPKAWEALEESK